MGRAKLSIISRNKFNKKSSAGGTNGIFLIFAFLLGCAISSTLILCFHGVHHLPIHVYQRPLPAHMKMMMAPYPELSDREDKPSENGNSDVTAGTGGVLAGIDILVAIASYDTGQLPHLEEVISSFRDVCEAGVNSIRVVIHTTVAYPVSWIDMMNSRTRCHGAAADDGGNSTKTVNRLQIDLVLVSPSVRLNLVDLHRTLFYEEENLENYDLMIYLEDDIRVTPTTIAAYLMETRRVRALVGPEKFSDYNVGVVRFEYNYPPDTTIDDNTRHLVSKTTRVYWEHSNRPVFSDAARALTKEAHAVLGNRYFSMKNNHQGMFLATPDLLRAWSVRGKSCRFDVVRQRPGMRDNPGQPTEGTQRVWMSSVMLHGKRHCNVVQLLPVDTFGSLTVHHLSNKNYRRVGKQGRLGGGGQHNARENSFVKPEVVDGPSPSLLSAIEFHVELTRKFDNSLREMIEDDMPYTGIMMYNQINYTDWYIENHPEYEGLVKQRMGAFEEYVSRGGIMSEKDRKDLLFEY